MHSLQQREYTKLPAVEASDDVLMQQAVAGDQHAFEALVDRYHDSVLGYSQTILKDKDQADDVLQFVFLQFYVFLPTLATGRSLKAWLFRVARNRCLDDLRKRRRESTLYTSAFTVEEIEEGMSPREGLLDPDPLPEEVVVTLEVQSLLQRALFTLSPISRAVVHLHSFEYLNFAEIAHILSLPLYTVKASFYRSLPRLRIALLKEGHIH